MKNPSTTVTALILAVVIALTATTAGCLGRKPAQSPETTQPQQPVEPAPAAPPAGTPATPQAAETTTVSIYLIDWPAQSQPSLRQAEREIPKGDSDLDTAPMKAALEALIAGPTAGEKSKGLSGPLPKSTKVLSVRMDGGVATVNFSKEIITMAASEAAVSATGEGLALESIRKTMANFPPVARVKILIEGKARGDVDGRLVEDFWGHIGLPEYLAIKDIAKEENRGGTGPQTIGKPADGMALKGVRWSWDSSKFRLVLDLENTDGAPAAQCPVVSCSLSASSRVLSIEVNGIRAIRDSRLAPRMPLMISSGPAVSLTLDSSEEKGDDQMIPLSLALNPSRSYTYRLFSLADPVRVVIDVFPE